MVHSFDKIIQFVQHVLYLIKMSGPRTQIGAEIHLRTNLCLSSSFITLFPLSSHVCAMTEVTEFTKMITLTSSDGVDFQISVAAAKLSDFIKDAHDFAGEVDLKKEYEPLHCVRVPSKTLESVVHYLTYYSTTKMHPISDPTKEVIPATYEKVVPQEWYRTYMDALELDGMWRVRSAALYMGIEPLTNLTNTWLAFHLMDKNVDQMHDILNIPKMTAEEVSGYRV
jgi:Skp1 family, tetramerisation domain